MSKQVMSKKLILSMAACLLAGCSPALAANAVNPNVNAGTILRDSQQVERKLPDRQQPEVKVEQVVKPPMAKDAGFKTIVTGYRITGQDLVSESELLSLLTDDINKELNMNGLQQAADKIAGYFRGKGYFLAQAYLPVQEINEGKVEIAVVIGRSGEIIIKNQTRVPNEVIMRQLKGIKQGDYISISNMERAVLLASDLPGVSAQTTLIPGKQPGTTDIVLEAKIRGNEWSGSISTNNWGSRLTGYNQGIASLNFNNPFQLGDSLTSSFTNSGEGLDNGSIAYHMPINEGSTLNLSYSKVYYSLGQDMSYLNANGTAYTNHIDWSYALRRSRNSNYSLQLGYDQKRMEDKIDYNSSVTQKRSHLVSIGLIGDSNDTFSGGGNNSYSLSHYRGNISGQTNSSTTLGNGSFNKTTYSLMRQQVLSEKLSLFLSLSGQLANTNLDSAEKFSLGGANGVRAYPAGEASGDEARLGTIELRYNMPTSNNSLWQASAFYDAGTSFVDKNPTQTLSPNRRSLSGAGIGLSYIVPGKYLIKANYAWRTCGDLPQADTTFGNGRLWLQGVKYF